MDTVQFSLIAMEVPLSHRKSFISLIKLKEDRLYVNKNPEFRHMS